MELKRRLLDRRTFMATGAAAGIGGAAWLGVSSSWGARFLRQRFEEVGRDIPPAPHKPTPATWSDNAVTLAWLGHATVLINFYGVRILTDPALYPRIGVDLGLGTLGPMRLVQCALTPDELPEIDLVLVSHAHFDHLDTPSLGSVRGKPAAVMAADISDLLPRRRYSSVRELRWNEAATVDDAAWRRADPRDRGQALGRAHPSRYVAWLHRMDRRARRPPAPHRRRHRCHARVQESSAIRSVRRGGHAHRRVRPVDLQPLHTRTGGRRWPMRRARA